MKVFFIYSLFIFTGIYIYSQIPYTKRELKYQINNKPLKHFSYF